MKLKVEFVTKKKSELADINTQIDKLAEKLKSASNAVKAEAKSEASSRIRALRGQAAKLNKQLDAANNIPESKWADFKSGFNKSYNEMKDAFKQSRRWLSKKIAP